RRSSCWSSSSPYSVMAVSLSPASQFILADESGSISSLKKPPTVGIALLPPRFSEAERTSSPWPASRGGPPNAGHRRTEPVWPDRDHRSRSERKPISTPKVRCGHVENVG